MKNLLIAVCCFLVTATGVSAQKESNIWYFGRNAGLDFNGGAPVAITDGALFTTEGCASVCDANGNLLFYTNGEDVWNKNHELMPNGFGLYGNYSTTQCVIVQKPDAGKLYYIFTAGEQGNGNGLCFTVVNMSLDGGLGDVSLKNSPLLTPACEKIVAIKNRSGTGIWLLTHKIGNDAFYAYPITAKGIDTLPVVSNAGVTIYSFDGAFAIGHLKASPDGSKIAITHSYLHESEILDFDNNTGRVSNAVSLSDTSQFPYGIEFSPDGKFLYLSEEGKPGNLYQYNLQAGNASAIINSKFKVATFPDEETGALQLGPDGKIYVSIYLSEYVGIIHEPNLLGAACNVDAHGIFLEGRLSELGLPPAVITIPHKYSFAVPQAFSPNQDGVNDYFTVFGDSIVQYEIRIFNRWGELVYHSNNTDDLNDLHKGWDGNFKAKEQETGNFIYHITGQTFFGEAIEQKGNLLLLR